ncbi:MAG TPA: hypothetical protein VFL83_10280 [Anaeromyxobacter sp.]|nr:hypothetical protein [Anaeromyxobacter sp.]
MSASTTRHRAVSRLERRVRLRAPAPIALALAAIVAGAGFLTSYALLQAGLRGMGLRYALSAIAAWVLLLVFLRAWVALAVPRLPDRDAAVGNALDAARDLGETAFRAYGDLRDGAGGLDLPVNAARGPSSLDVQVELPDPPPRSGGSGLDVLSGLDLDFDGPVGLAVVGLVLAALGVLAGVVFVLSEVPGLFAEIVLDGVLAAGLYRRVRRGLSCGAWWIGAFRRTLVPAVAVIALLGLGGLAMQKAVPCAASIGQIWAAVVAPSPRAPGPHVATRPGAGGGCADVAAGR